MMKRGTMLWRYPTERNVIYDNTMFTKLIWTDQVPLHGGKIKRLREDEDESDKQFGTIIGNGRCDDFDTLKFLHVGMKTLDRYLL